MAAARLEAPRTFGEWMVTLASGLSPWGRRGAPGHPHRDDARQLPRATPFRDRVRGEATALVVMKIVLTYAVPFLVSTYSALEINRQRHDAGTSSEPAPPHPGAMA